MPCTPHNTPGTLVIAATVVIAAVASAETPGYRPHLERVSSTTIKSNYHLVDDYSARGTAGRIQAVVEIPAGTHAKWEVDKRDGNLKHEIRANGPRYVQYLPYPVNYGMVPRTLLPEAEGGDNDPLDVMVLGPSLPRGMVLQVRLIGVLKLIDSGEHDDKLIAVRSGTPFAGVKDMDQLQEQFPGTMRIIETWMTHYKGAGIIRSQGTAGASAAREILEKAIKAYADTRKRH